MEEVISQNCPTSPFFKLKFEYFTFFSKLQKTVKTSPCFKLVGLPPDLYDIIFVTTFNLLYFLNGLTHLVLLEMSIINYEDIKTRENLKLTSQ